MRINRNLALSILEEQVASQEPTPPEWDELIENLAYEVSQGANKTFIAMLGTALLARATDLRADPFALKSGSETPGAYSARGLCQHVLAAHAPRLGIDLGVTGREPLNNQPFFAEDRVHQGLPVHARAAAGFKILMDGLAQISSIDASADAKGALRAFVKARNNQRYTGKLETGRLIGLNALFEHVGRFVAGNSEFGRRAQAVAAGLLDAAGVGEVVVSKVNDPDRHLPGDVNVLVDGEMTHAFEVRDKPVNEPDVYHFINKVAEAGGTHAAVVAAAPGQERLDLVEVVDFAESKGVVLGAFYTWNGLLSSALFWGSGEMEGVASRALEAIHARAIQLEVSEEGVRELEDVRSR